MAAARLSIYSWKFRAPKKIYGDVCVCAVPQIIEGRSASFPSMFVWHDIVQMSLQMAGGAPGPDAVAAAEQLLALPPSVFTSRYAGSCLGPCLLLFALESQASMTVMVHLFMPHNTLIVAYLVSQ